MEEVLLRIAKKLEQKRYGKFRGVVADNQDPEQRGRLKLQVPAVLGKQKTDWALPCLPFGGDAGCGWFAVPKVGAQVWVEFEEGDIQRPIWTGTFWPQQNQVPKEAQKSDPTTYLFQTPAGHVLQFDDASGKERFRLLHPSKAQVLIDHQGVMTLTDAQGSKITLDAQNSEIVVADVNGNTITLSASGTTVEDVNGNKLEMAASGVKVQAQQVVIQGGQVMLGGQGGEPVIKGQSFLTLFATHTHPVSGGSSGPPVPQGEMSTLSTKVLTT